MQDLITQHRMEFEKALDFLKSDISGLRTGRATPSLVEDTTVEAYGTKQPLKALASITIQDAKTILIDPWDKSVVMAIDGALRKSSMGFNPVNDGSVIRIPLPELSSERRQELIKVLGQKLEHSKIAVRKIREEIKDKIEKEYKDKEISEDEKFKMIEGLEKTVKEFNDLIKEIGEKKEKEILEV